MPRRFRYAIVAVVVLAAFLYGCRIDSRDSIEGSGTSTEQTYDVSDYAAVAFSLPGTIYITQDGTESVRIEGDDNLIANTTVEVRDGTLYIEPKTEDLSFEPSSPLEAYVSVDELTSLRMAGRATADVQALETPSFSVSTAGAGSTTIESIDAQSLSISSAGSGDVRTKGSVRSLTMNIAGSGDLDAPELRTDSASFQIAGSGNARLHVNDHVDVRIMGSGNIRYTGSPRVSSSILGSGEVVKVDQ
jgi:hypothetical protein